jgi:hypothetical protein
MKFINKTLIAIAVILVAGCAAFFSITGLGLLFKSTSVMFMAGSLEYAKLVTAQYLKIKWDELGKWVKLYLSFAVVVLMLITSMGIYGFLSDAFKKQSIIIEQVERTVSVLENNIKINKEEIDRHNKQINNLNQIRNSQENNLSKLIEQNKSTSRVYGMIDNAETQILSYSEIIDSLNNGNLKIYKQIDSVKNQNIDIEREVGGFRFISESFDIPLNKAVKWFILLIVFVFDPLAIALVIAFNTKPKVIVEELKNIEMSVEIEKEVKRGRPKKYDKSWVKKLKDLENPKEYILNTIGDGLFACELGVSEGFTILTEKYFVDKGYKILAIDGDANMTEVKHHRIIQANILPLLKTYRCPKNYDLLKIDLSGNDFYILNDILKNFTPRLIMAAFNPSIDSGKSVSIAYNENFVWANDNYYGFSFDAGKKLASKNGYTIVLNCENTLYMVKNDYLYGVEIPEIDYEVKNIFGLTSTADWVEV